MRFLLRAGLWSLWLLCAAVIAQPWIEPYSKPGILLATRTLQSPKSDGYLGIVITGRAKTGLLRTRRPDHLTVMVWKAGNREHDKWAPDQRGVSLQIDTSCQSARILDETDQPTGPSFDLGTEADSSASIQQWFDLNRISGDAAQLKSEALEVSRMVRETDFVARTQTYRNDRWHVQPAGSPQQAMNSESFATITNMVGFSALSDSFIDGEMMTVWSVVWLLGCGVLILVTWRGQRRMKQTAAALLDDRRITRLA